MSNISKYSLGIVFYFICFNLTAEHIIGGQFEFDCIDYDLNAKIAQLDVTFTMYRNSLSFGANFDQEISIGLYELTNGNWTVSKVIELSSFSDLQVYEYEYDEEFCRQLPNDFLVEEAKYSFDLSIESTGNDYMLVYQRCCKDSNILNISNPEEIGSAFYIIMTDESITTCNSSPGIGSLDQVINCANYELEYQLDMIDEESDSIVYSFISPLTAGGTDGSTGNFQDQFSCTGVTPSPAVCIPPYDSIVFLPPYSIDMPFQSDNTINLSSDGILSAVPTTQGQFIIGILIREYRNGKKLSESIHEVNLYFIYCEEINSDQDFEINSDVAYTNDRVFEINLVQNDVLNESRTYEFNFTNNDKIQSISTTNTFGVFDVELVSSVSDTVHLQYEICDLVCKSCQQTSLIIFKDQIGIVNHVISCNNDNYNDVLVVSQTLNNLKLNYPCNSINIFNRWGQPVYNAAPYDNDWCGTYMNTARDLPEGTYYFELDLFAKSECDSNILSNNVSSVYFGSITLLR